MRSSKITVVLVLLEIIWLAAAFARSFGGDGYIENFGNGEKAIPTWESAVPLAKGSYVMDVTYEATSEAAYIRPMMDAPAGMVYGSKVLLPSYQKEVSFEVRVDSDTNCFYLDSGTEDDLTITGLTVRRTNQAETAHCITLLVLFLLLDVLLILWRQGVFEKLGTEQKNIITGFFVIWLISSLPLLVNYMVTGHDFAFHMMRIEGLVKGLKSGQFPVKVQPGWLNGYGYPVSVMYGDLLLYIPALLRVGGFTLQASYKIYVLLVNAITVATAYFCVKKISGECFYAGLLGSFVYSLSIYRLVNIYTRYAVGEYTAMAFFPLAFLGLYLVLHTKEVRRGCAFMILGYTLILQSHLLSFEMIVTFSAFYCLLCGKKFLKRLAIIIKTAAIAILLNLNFLIPFADYMLHENLWIKGGTPENMQAHGLFLPQLLQLYGSTGGGSTEASGGMQADMLIGPGILIMLAFFAFAWLFFVYRKGLKERMEYGVWREQCVLFLLLAASLLMVSLYFPWKSIGVIPVFGKIFASYQFAWRFLAIAVLVGTVLWGFLCNDIRLLFGQKAAGSCIVGICSLAVFFSLWFINGKMTESEALIVTDTAGINTVNAVSGGEYLVQGMAKDYVTETELTYSEYVTITDCRRDENHFWVRCENKAEAEGYVTVPLFAYKSYRAVDTATGEQFILMRNSNGVVQVTLPSGYSGEIEIYYRERTIWRIGECVSLVTLIGLLLNCVTVSLKRTQKKNY